MKVALQFGYHHQEYQPPKAHYKPQTASFLQKRTSPELKDSRRMASKTDSTHEFQHFELVLRTGAPSSVLTTRSNLKERPKQANLGTALTAEPSVNHE